MKTKPCLTLDDCRKIGAAAQAEARKNNWIVVVAILDDGGHLLWLERMDGATPFNAQVAVEKGRSATPGSAWETCEDALARDDLAQGSRLLGELLAQTPPGELAPAARQILDECCAQLCAGKCDSPEYILLALHAYQTGR